MAFLSKVPSYSHVVFPVCIGLAILIVLGALLYAKLGMKKSIFSIVTILAVLVPLTITPAYADKALQIDEDKRQEMANYLRSNSKNVCKLVDEKEDISKASDINQRDYDMAEQVYSYAVALGRTNEEGYECAEKYLAKANQAKKKEDKKCSPITSLIKSYLNKDSCWPCDITGVIIFSIQRVAIASYSVVQTAALSLLGVMFLFWLAYSTLAYFGKFGFARISEYLTSVLNKAVLVMIVATLLHAPLVNIYRFTISPFVQYASGLAISLSEFGQQEVDRTANMIATVADFLSGDPDCDYCSRVGSTNVSNNQFLDDGTVNSILCTVCTVYKQVTPMISLGQALMCFASSAPKSNHDTPSVSEQSSFAIPSVSGYFVGMLLVILFSLLMVIVGFHIMAATMKLGFVLILAPFWMVFYVFKPTRSYTGKAWVLVIHSMVTMIALSIAVALVLIGFNHILTNKVIIGFMLMAMMKSPTEMLSTFAGSFDGTDPLSSGEESDDGNWASGFTESLISYGIGQLTDFSPVRTMVLIASYCMLSIGLIDKAAAYVERLANAFIQLSNTDADNMYGGIGATLGVAAAVGRTGGAVGKDLKDKIFNGDRFAGKDADGNSNRVYARPEDVTDADVEKTKKAKEEAAKKKGNK